MDRNRLTKSKRWRPETRRRTCATESSDASTSWRGRIGGETEFRVLPPQCVQDALLRSYIRKRAWALEDACKRGDLERARSILSLVVDAGERAETVNAAAGSLYWAAANGHAALVDLLVANGANVNLAYGMTR